jgi:hypothetical protein
LVAAKSTSLLYAAEQAEYKSTSCLAIAVILIYLNLAIDYADIDSLDATLNEAEIAPDSASLTQSVNNVLKKLNDDNCLNLPQGQTDYLNSADFTEDHLFVRYCYLYFDLY